MGNVAAVTEFTATDDTLNTVYDNFCYDDLNRLSQYSVNGTDCGHGSNVKIIGYDGGTPGAYANGAPGDGNISSKSDLGSYTYGQNGAGPHVVTGINTTAGEQGGCTLARCTVDGISNPNFYYDSDGNMQCITTATSCDQTAGRSYWWTSFDMVAGIGAGSPSATLAYTPEHRRGSLTANGATMYYLNNPAGADMEELMTGAPNSWHTYLYAYGHIAAEFFTSGSTTTPYYFVGDHLLSTVALSDASGNQLEDDSYDAWGRRRNADGADYSTGCLFLPKPLSKTTRGFTGQEEMDSFCLVNLNGRIYDPAFGRMLSADPMVSKAENGQAFDRYSYALNEPLTVTDPSGYVDQCQNGSCGPPWDCIDGCDYSGMSFNSAVETITVIGTRYSQGDFPDIEVAAPPPYIPGMVTRDFGGDNKQDKPRDQNKSKQTVCTGTGRGLAGNTNFINKQGGIPGQTVQSGTAAVIPQQFGVASGADLSDYAGSIYGTIGQASFSSITDVIGGRSPIRGRNVRDALQQLNPGELILEIPGASDQGQNAPVTITVPPGLNCPTGTTAAGDGGDDDGGGGGGG